MPLAGGRRPVVGVQYVSECVCLLDPSMTAADDRPFAPARRAPPRAAVLVGIAIACVLGGCSTSESVNSMLIDPGHYSVFHCKDFAGRLQGIQARQKELLSLQAKASEGGGGALIGNLSYRTDYESSVAEERVLRRTAADKKCDLPPPAEPVVATPTAYTAPTVAPAPPLAAPAAAAPPAGSSVPVFQSDQTIR
jgi:hypothetical protein